MKYSDEEKRLITIIDTFERMFWRDHEILPGKDFKAIVEAKRSAVKILKEKFGCTDQMIPTTSRIFLDTKTSKTLTFT